MKVLSSKNLLYVMVFSLIIEREAHYNIIFNSSHLTIAKYQDYERLRWDYRPSIQDYSHVADPSMYFCAA